MLKSISNCLCPIPGDIALADEVHALVAAFYNLVAQSYCVRSYASDFDFRTNTPSPQGCCIPVTLVNPV